MRHPSSLDLEAFACGEPVASVDGHLHECADCASFVERLRGAMSAGPSLERAALVVGEAERADSARRRARSDLSDAAVLGARPRRPALEGVRGRWLAVAGPVAASLAAALLLVLFVRTPATTVPSAPVLPPSTASTASTADPSPETTFKGDIQIAVIREREGEQARFTGKVEVKPGDRLRVEVALDRQQAIASAVLGDDGSWLELMSEEVLPPGTHFSDRTARVDSSPLHGTILVGSPESIAQARFSRRFDEVPSIRVEWSSR